MKEASMTERSEREWQAKEIVRNKIEKSSEFKKAVTQTMGDIKRMGGNIKVTSKKGK